LICVSRRSAHTLLKHDFVLQTETPSPSDKNPRQTPGIPNRSGTGSGSPTNPKSSNTHSNATINAENDGLMFQRQWQRRHETQIRRLKDCKARPKIATWNCRGLTVDTITPTGELKLKCLINRMLIQHWGCIVLTDTQGPDTIREFSYHGRQWTIELHFC
jgi:hypothetical protein